MQDRNPRLRRFGGSVLLRTLISPHRELLCATAFNSEAHCRREDPERGKQLKIALLPIYSIHLQASQPQYSHFRMRPHDQCERQTSKGNPIPPGDEIGFFA